jgi:hypothetical protein
VAEGAGDRANDSQRPSGAAWSASNRSTAAAWLSAKLVISIVFAGALGVAAWQGSGAWFQEAARQRVSNHWSELRRCLLGDGRASATRPSQRLHDLQLGVDEADADWPSRCEPFARQLDTELATRSMREQLGSLPSAVEIVQTLAGADLDTLHDALEAADLPTPTATPTAPRKVPAAPAPVTPLLKAQALATLATARQPLQLALDPDDGQRLRVLFGGEQAKLCVLDGGPAKERWQRASCRDLTVSGGDDVDLRLARGQRGAPDVLYRRPPKGPDGFFDATSGIRLWRPHDPSAQAVVLANGTTTVLYTRRKRDGSVDGHRLTQLRPGRAPTSRRLKVDDQASLLLMPDALLWWSRESKSADTIYGRALRQRERWVGPRYNVGSLPTRSRYVDDCASGYTQAVLFASGDSPPRYTLLFREQGMFNKTVDVGVLSGASKLSCHGDRAIVTRRRGSELTVLSCASTGCQQNESDGLPGFEHGVAVVATVGDQQMLVWSEPGAPLRMRIGKTAELATAADRLLLDDAQHGGVDAKGLQMVSADGIALLLVEAAGGKLHPIRIDASGNVSAVTVQQARAAE